MTKPTALLAASLLVLLVFAGSSEAKTPSFKLQAQALIRVLKAQPKLDASADPAGSERQKANEACFNKAAASPKAPGEALKTMFTADLLDVMVVTVRSRADTMARYTAQLKRLQIADRDLVAYRSLMSSAASDLMKWPESFDYCEFIDSWAAAGYPANPAGLPAQFPRLENSLFTKAPAVGKRINKRLKPLGLKLPA